MKIPQIGELLELEDEQATIDAGRQMADELSAGMVVALCGPLGAGKTHFSKGLAFGLGIGDAVSSPTFGLVHEYRDGRLSLFHFDLYRADCPEEIEDIGWDDYLESGGVVVAEWADRFPGLFPADTVWLRLDYSTDRAQRVIERIEG